MVDWFINAVQSYRVCKKRHDVHNEYVELGHYVGKGSKVFVNHFDSVAYSPDKCFDMAIHGACIANDWCMESANYDLMGRKIFHSARIVGP